MKKKIRIRVNDQEWTLTSQRSDKPCTGCGKPTQGRIKAKAWCLDCGVKQLLSPIKTIRKVIEGAKA